jgi:TolB-like protein/Flp pilus assembly protein TadD
MKNFFEELKRRNVIKATIAYLVISWILLQVASIVLPIVEAPNWVLKTFTFFLAIGFPIWILITWVYEVTPEGLKKTAKVSEEKSITATTNKRLNILILITLLIAIAVALSNPNITTSVTPIADSTYSIAVLPFSNMSADEDNEWFGDGVTEDILTNLSKIKGLRVISRTSVNQYKNSKKTIPEIAKELGVAYVVEGSVRTQNNKVLITAQLIKANDEHIWAENYTEVLEDAFDIQRDVSKKIAQQLKINISPEEEIALSKAPTNNMEAYQLYIKGRSIADSRTKENLEKSIDYYKKAIALDSNYAEAYAEIANSNFLLVEYAGKPLDEATKESKEWISKALSINPNTVRAYSTLGYIAANNSEWEVARINFEKAIALNPNDATTHHHYSLYYRSNPEKDFKKSLEQISIAQELDPFSHIITSAKIIALLLNNNFKEAGDLLSKNRFMFSQDEVLLYSILIKVNQDKDWTEAISILKKAVEESPNDADLHLQLSWAYFDILNDRDKSLVHSKKAYDLDVKTGAFYYLYFLIHNDLSVAKSLLSNQNFMKILSKDEVRQINTTYFWVKGDYKKAMEYYNNIPDSDAGRAMLFALMGDRAAAYELLKNNNINKSSKAVVFANLKERDSMYYYLNCLDIYQAKDRNGDTDLDPYRKEPRYKAFLKKNYLPIIEK